MKMLSGISMPALPNQNISSDEYNDWKIGIIMYVPLLQIALHY